MTAAPPPATATAIVLCYGNICRSPMGEVLLRRELEERGLGSRVQVESAGYLGDGHPAHAYAILAMKRRGLDLSGHGSTLLTPMRIHRARWILAMEEQLAERARLLGATNAYNLAPWATLGEDRADVEDPIGQEVEVFEACARRLEALVPRAVERMVLELDKERARRPEDKGTEAS